MDRQIVSEAFRPAALADPLSAVSSPNASFPSRTLVRWFGILLVLGLGAIAVALVVLVIPKSSYGLACCWESGRLLWRTSCHRAARSSPKPSRPVMTLATVYNDVGIRTAPDPRREYREYQAQLERTFRREMEQALNEHLARLRGEVALLRNDLVEKVNGQLRLERTETTRALGSDIEGCSGRSAGSRPRGST